MLVLPLGFLAYGWLAPDRSIWTALLSACKESRGRFASRFHRAGPLRMQARPMSACLFRIAIPGETILDAAVDLAVQAPNGGGKNENETVRATREQSTNKLLEAATVNLPSLGSWELRIRCWYGGETTKAIFTFVGCRAAGLRMETGPQLSFLRYGTRRFSPVYFLQAEPLIAGIT